MPLAQDREAMQDSDAQARDRSDTNPAPASPCNGVCRLDAQQVCVGCGRHVAEIVAAGVEAERRRQES